MIGWISPHAPALQKKLAELIDKRESDEMIVVHHVEDFITYTRISFERRSKILGFSFEHIEL